MISDFRKKKYMFMFERYFDLDKNGVIDIRDIAILIDRICRIKGWEAGSPQYINTHKIWYKIFEGMLKDVEMETCDGLTPDLWMEIWDKYKNNPPVGLKWQKEMENFTFTYCKDTKINGWTLQSTVPAFVDFGIDENEAKRAFKKASQGRDYIPAEDFPELFNQFYTSDDPKAPGNFIHGKESF